jgi:hypothetical protein
MTSEVMHNSGPTHSASPQHRFVIGPGTLDQRVAAGAPATINSSVSLIRVRHPVMSLGPHERCAQPAARRT